MKDNRTDNKVQATATAAEAEKETNGEIAAGLHKFKDVQTLIEAYQALEAEFTRRSQKLKELEASLANKETEAPVKAENAEAPSQKAAEEGGQRPLTDDEKNAVIAEYLNGVCANRGVPFVTGGGAVRAARTAPKTLREAGTLARNFFDKKED